MRQQPFIKDSDTIQSLTQKSVIMICQVTNHLKENKGYGVSIHDTKPVHTLQ